MTSTQATNSRDRNARSRRRGRDRGQSQQTGQGIYAPQTIQHLPTLPWDHREQQQTIVAEVNHFALRLFHGEPGHPYDNRSRPAGFLLNYILTRFRGEHLPLAMKCAADLMANTPSGRGTVKMYRETARVALDADNRQEWLTALLRAIEIETFEYVVNRIQGTSAGARSRKIQAIKRDLITATSVLEATDSQRRLAICLICQLAIQVTQDNYEHVPERLQRCIQLLGDELGMQDAATQLTGGIIDEASWTMHDTPSRHETATLAGASGIR